MIKRIVIVAVAFSLLFNISVFAMDNANIHNNTINTCKNDNNFYIVKTDGSLYRVPYIEYDDDNDIEVSLNDMIPTKIQDDVISFSSNCILKEDGSVWDRNDENSDFVMVTDNVRSISSFSAELVVKNDSSLWGKGSNSVGQLAQGEMDKSLEQQIEDDLKWRNKTGCHPEYYDEPVKIMDDVKTAVTDWAVSVVLKNDGTVWTFGRDQGGGALGIGGRWLVNNNPTKILSGIKEVFIRGEAGFALDYDNTLWRWGSNYIGWSGISEHDQLSPSKYANNAKYATNMPGYNLVIKTDNSLWIYGDTDEDSGHIGYTSPSTPIKLSEGVADVIGLDNTDFDNDRVLVLKENGDLMLYEIPLYEDKEPYLVGKIMGNVRLSDEKPIKKSFADILDEAKETQQSINSLAKANIISGTSETEFSPDKPITRAEIAALLLRMTAKNDENGNGGFADVTADDWYYDTAGASKEYNIVAGFEDNTFRGDETISKVQLISLAARTLRNEGHVTEAVNVADINAPEWAVNDLSLALQEGLISQNDLKDIDGSMTRADAAVILYKLYAKI